jgi:hypothetical protein
MTRHKTMATPRKPDLFPQLRPSFFPHGGKE